MILKRKFKLKGGIKFRRKEYINNCPAVAAPIPGHVVLSLMQQPNIFLKPVLSKGKNVLAGEKIAESEEKTSVPLHSSISGKIKEISEYPHPFTGEKTESIVIESDGKDDHIVPEKIYSDYFRYAPAELLQVIRAAGIIGLGGEGFSAHEKFNRGKKELDHLIVNAVECDPYLSCDSVLIREYAGIVIDGIKMLMYILDVHSAIIAVSENNAGVIKIFESLSFHVPNIFIAPVPSMYPQGEERVLVKTILGKTVPLGSSSYSVGAIVSNVATIYAVARALKHGENLFSRIVTVKGPDGKIWKNLWVRNGTLIKDLAEFSGINLNETNYAVIGGIMRGKMHKSFDVPLIKTTRGVSFLSAKDEILYENIDCIRCGKCIEICPAGLLPNRISMLVQKGETKAARIYGVEACIECGCCSCVCPSYRPISTQVQTAKEEINKENVSVEIV